MDYDIKSIIDIIEISKKYEKGRKRPRESGIQYNFDLERLKDCIEPLKKLNALIGMDDIKKNIIDQILFFTQELNTNEMMHVCITGPPGAGKTTMGTILAELYCSMGFLSKGNVKFATRDQLIGGYLGQTAIKTKKLLKEAIGNALVIDEVYSLGYAKGDSDSYAKECVDTINQFLSENTENFLMIIMGYSEDIDKYFFSMNPGLRRRFPWRYEIKDYTPTNLKEIFKYQVEKNGWEFDDDFNFSDLDQVFSQKEYFKDNGGSCLILFDKTKITHARRVFGQRRRFKKKLSMPDILQAFEIMKKANINGKIDLPPYGMYL